MKYRRVRIEGGCYFFTVALADRKSNLLVTNVDALRAAVKTVKANHPFTIDAMVVLPDHIHALWTLPQGDDNYSMRWMLIKRHFSMSLPKTENIKMTRMYKRERGIWQRRFWEHTIRDEKEFYNHIEYIHHNPVKHGYVSNAKDWLYSTFICSRRLWRAAQAEERTATFIIANGTTFCEYEKPMNDTHIWFWWLRMHGHVAVRKLRLRAPPQPTLEHHLDMVGVNTGR